MVCTECGKTYSDKMAFCPFCNAPKEESLELEMIDLDDVLEFEEVEEQSEISKAEEKAEDNKIDDSENQEELVLELEEELELEVTEEPDKKEYKSFDDLNDFSGLERVEIKIDRREYKENELMIDPEDIKYYLKQDKHRIKIIAFLALAIVGSFFNFWSIATNDTLYGNIQMGSLFAGYGLGGILGKLCVVLLLAGIVLVVINLTKYALWVTLAAAFSMITQIVVAVLSAIKEDFIYANVCDYLYPDLGFAIMTVALLVAIILLFCSPEKLALKRKEAKDNEPTPEEELKAALAEQADDIQKQKEKLQAKEDKRAEKELAKAEKKAAKEAQKLSKAENKKNKKNKKKNGDESELLELELVDESDDKDSGEIELQFEEIDDDIKSKKSKKQKKG